MSLESCPNPYMESGHFFTEDYNPVGKEAQDFPGDSHRIYINLDQIVAMWVTWWVDGPYRGTPKEWLIHIGAQEMKFKIPIGNKIFEALKRRKGLCGF